MLDNNLSYCGADILCRFPTRAIKEVLEVANGSISQAVLDASTSIIDKELYEKIIWKIQEHIELYPRKQPVENNNDGNSDSSSSDSSVSIDNELSLRCCPDASSSDFSSNDEYF